MPKLTSRLRLLWTIDKVAHIQRQTRLTPIGGQLMLTCNKKMLCSTSVVGKWLTLQKSIARDIEVSGQRSGRMRYRPTHGFFIAVSLLAFSCSWVRGTLSYQYEFSQSNYTVAAGGTVDVEVFLQETGATGDPFVLAPGGNGLTGTGVAVSFGTVATVTSTSDIGGNAAFDNGGFGIATSLTSTSAGFTQSTLFNPPVIGTANGLNSYDLLLGTFTFTAQKAPGSEVITAGRFNPALSEVITNSGAVLDGSIANATATISIPGATTSVPELGTIGSGAICLLVSLGYMKLSSVRKLIVFTRQPVANKI